jgi:hypothetical protein
MDGALSGLGLIRVTGADEDVRATAGLETGATKPEGGRYNATGN